MQLTATRPAPQNTVSDLALARHFLALADAAGDRHLAQHFIDIAHDLFDGIDEMGLWAQS